MNLVLNDVYVYDIVSCHYTILKSLGYNLSDIDINDKESRNIKIGLMMKDNPILINVLRSITKSIVDGFILNNNIKENEIILRNYDGLLLTKPINIIDHDNIKLILRDSYHKFIMANENSYIAINSDNKLVVKGVSNKYDRICEYYLKILKINYSNKKSIFYNLQKIKDDIVYSEDIELFCIPSSSDKYEIILKRYGKIKISETIIDMMDHDEIDKISYFNLYLKIFFDSIVMNYI